jgi:Topoisomerase C-terminal repeat/HMG (high mobility group) box
LFSVELGAGVLAEIGEKEGSRILVKSGRFGMYLTWNKVNAKIPTEYHDDPSDIPLEEAWELIQEKVESSGSKVAGTKKKQGALSVELPQGPKRPLSAYLHFCAVKRGDVAKTSSSLGETSKELARLWSETSEQDRRMYHDLADRSKDEYQAKKATWQKECKKMLSKAGKPQNASPTSTSTEPTMRRPRSAYVYFCSSKRPEVVEKFSRLGDVSKELARMWKAASVDDRQVFEAMASADKLRFEQEKSGVLATHPKKSDMLTKKRGPSAYLLFCAAKRNSIVDENGKKLPLGETTKRLAKIWNECDDATKNEFMEQAEQQKATLV